MKYLEFKNKVKDLPIISSSLFGYLDSNEQVLRNQLSRWKKQGLILELKKGLYVLNENDRKVNISRLFLANQLYPPSYISNEYALMYYNLIPERVVDITSVTTRKTANFRNAFGLFVYQHISPERYDGFVEKKDENDHSFFIACAEKAVVDFIYLNLPRFERDKPDIFEESFRFQNYSSLSSVKMKRFSRLFNKNKLNDIVEMFCRLIQKGR